ncbi:MAG: threonylcarbamoyl-AMP synthase [Lachnospiraceae bacterium]|nr:threonylcarbamoyl-AMP synthase [Lachnospiraceae bacterium]
MKTRYIHITESTKDDQVIAEAGRCIQDGGLVAFPTETVYGLGGNAFNRDAARRIYAAKGRPSDNPLIVHIADAADLDQIAAEVPEDARRLAEAFWPGPLTMIFKKKSCVPDETTGGRDTVAVRFPDQKTAQKLIRSAGGFVCAPSANLSGKPSPTTGRDVLEDMDGRIDMILDDGESVIGLESTIIDMTEEPPVLLRPGAVTVEMIRECIPDLSTGQESRLEKEAHPRAPGMKYRHYAPQAPLILVDSDQAIRDLCVQAAGEGKKVGVLTSREHASFYEASCVRILGGEADEEEMAHNLFASLRAFDREGVDVIYSETFDEQGIGMALMNRLRKAAQKG